MSTKGYTIASTSDSLTVYMLIHLYSMMGSVYESGWEDTVREGVDKQHSSNMLSLSLLLLLLHIMSSQNRIKLITKYKYNLGLFAKRQGLVSV